MPIITFIRHGETNYNIEGKFTGRLEAHLTENGIKEAKEKSKSIEKNFDYIYRSPLIRTKETLDAILPGKKAIIDKRIIETSMGEWEGQNKDNLDQELLKAFRNGEYTPPGGETREEVINRVSSFIEDMFNNYKSNDKIFVITHAGILKALQIEFLKEKMSRVDNLQTIVIDNDIYNNYLSNK